MGTKTSQLQIRVSPEQKASLKRMATAAGMSVSEYVLTQVIPQASLEVGKRARSLASDRHRHRTLSELLAFLARLSPSELTEAVVDLDLDDLAPAPRNYVAASIEQEARRKGVTPPGWVLGVRPPDRPHFAWDLRSLRPHLMRVTPAAFKRRNVFVAVGGETRPERMTTHPADAADIEARFDALSRELEGVDVAAETCLVGGAVLSLSFAARPDTRRPDALFASSARIAAAERRVGEGLGLQGEWLHDAVRRFVGQSGTSGRFYEGPALRVFAAPPGYVLAMKCCSMAFVATDDDRAAVDADVRYLLRFLGLRTPEDATVVLARYLTERQHPPDLVTRLAALM